MSIKRYEETEVKLRGEQHSLQKNEEFDPSLRAIFEQVKSENELGLHRIEFLEKKSLDLLAFTGVILGIIFYGVSGIGDKIAAADLLMPFAFLILSLVFNLLAIIPGMVHGGPTACQLDELESWKNRGIFEMDQLYKRWIEEYGRDSVKNGKIGLRKWSCHNVGMLSFLAGLALIAVILTIKLHVLVQVLLVAFISATIWLYNCHRYDQSIPSFNEREKRFIQLICDEKWKKLGSRHAQ